MAAEENDHPLSTNEEIDEIEFGDNMVDITGAIIRDDPNRGRANAVRASNQPYRVILSNMNGRNIRILFWGKRIAEFQRRLIGQIVRIIRGKANESNPQYRRREDNLTAFEIYIQPHTIVSILKPIPQSIPQSIDYNVITFEQAGHFTGHVSLTGYIKLPIERVTTNNSTYGAGIITDAARYRLSVFVTDFDKNASPEIGSHVTITGNLRRNENQVLVLQIPNMTHITVINDVLLTEQQIRAGFRVPGRNRQTPDVPNMQQRRSLEESNNETNAPQPLTQRPRMELQGADAEFQPSRNGISQGGMAIVEVEEAPIDSVQVGAVIGEIEEEAADRIQVRAVIHNERNGRVF